MSVAVSPNLEHFSHIEDVVAFIKQHVPANADATTWKNVCEDVMHCELDKVEPVLTTQLKTTDTHAHTEDEIRGLLRAASWYTHPQLTTEALLKQVELIKTTLIPLPNPKQEGDLNTIFATIQNHVAGHEALPAAQAIEELLAFLQDNPSLSALMIPAHELRDQIYYQLLYPHWFAIVEAWHTARSKKEGS